MKKKIKINVDSHNEEIKINNLSSQEIVIDYSEDVDFTMVISELTKIISDKTELTIEEPDIDEENEKLKVVLETLKEIFTKYEESLSEDIDEEDGIDLPF